MSLHSIHTPAILTEDQINSIRLDRAEDSVDHLHDHCAALAGEIDAVKRTIASVSRSNNSTPDGQQSAIADLQTRIEALEAALGDGEEGFRRTTGVFWRSVVNDNVRMLHDKVETLEEEQGRQSARRWAIVSGAVALFAAVWGRRW